MAKLTKDTLPANGFVILVQHELSYLPQKQEVEV